ncbi:MAG: hypothetical protein ACE5FW_02955, partial [Candidatus Aenigmatarchaeota archaeon]
YRIKKKVFGRRFTNAGRCCGYHQHYAMPRGMYDRKRGQVRYVVKSKLKKTLIDSYNVLNAIDPIITVFLQSSPFAEGRHLAKDSRLLLYRGGKKLGYMEGLYARRQFFGGLSPYKQTLSDLMGTLERKHRRWIELMAKHGFKGSAYAKSTNILHFSWNAVKVSPKGTLEYRGADMNFTENILGATTLVKFLLRKIQQDFMFVVPADMEMKEAFKQEGNLLFIPPHSVVRKELQKRSAYQGLADKELYRYVKRFMRFMGPNVYKEYRFLLRPLKRMVDSKRTVSDQILKKARKDGYGKGPIPERYARELALFYAERFRKDIPMLKEKLENIVF